MSSGSAFLVVLWLRSAGVSSAPGSSCDGRCCFRPSGWCYAVVNWSLQEGPAWVHGEVGGDCILDKVDGFTEGTHWLHNNGQYSVFPDGCWSTSSASSSSRLRTSKRLAVVTSVWLSAAWVAQGADSLRSHTLQNTGVSRSILGVGNSYSIRFRVWAKCMQS